MPLRPDPVADGQDTLNPKATSKVRKARREAMCQKETPCQEETQCQKPEHLTGTPKDCSPEQIKKCHGPAAEHPCCDKPAEK